MANQKEVQKDSVKTFLKTISMSFRYYDKYRKLQGKNLANLNQINHLERKYKTLEIKSREAHEIKNSLENIGMPFVEEDLHNLVIDLVKKNRSLKKQDTSITLHSQLKEYSEPIFQKEKNPINNLKNFLKYKKEFKEFNDDVGKHALSIQYTLESDKPQKPDGFSVEDRDIKVNDTFRRFYYLSGLPSMEITPGVLYRILNCPFPLTISMHIKETSNIKMIRACTRIKTIYDSAQKDRVEKGAARKVETDVKIEELDDLIDKLVRGYEKAFWVQTQVCVEGKSKEELLKNCETFENTAEETQLTFNVFSYGQDEAYKSILPYTESSINKELLIQTTLLSYLFPLSSINDNDPQGIFFGRNVLNDTLKFIDFFKARNYNINIFGSSGSGKSATAKVLIDRLFLRKIQNIIVDPEGEYIKLTKQLEGEVVKFSRETVVETVSKNGRIKKTLNGHGINPFYIGSEDKEDYRDHIQILKEFFKFFIKEEKYDSAKLDKALMKTYENGNPDIKKLIKILGDDEMVGDLEVLETGSLAGIFNSSKKVDLNKDLITFDLSAFNSEEVKKPAMFLLAAIISKLVKNTDRFKMVWIDEAHTLLSNEATARFYNNLVKRIRKYKGGVVSITQNPEDFLNKDKFGGLGIGIITQAETNILLKQSDASIDPVSNAFSITENEKVILPHLQLGESIVIREGQHMRLNLTVLDSERELVFT